MAYEIQLTEAGGPDRLTFVERSLPPPGPGELYLRQAAMGVNFIDIYQRNGLYPLPRLPIALGVEGAGVVEAVGTGVSAFAPGDRVAYAGLPVGGYASHRLLPASRAVRLPEDIGDKLAASVMLRGLTAHMLLHRVYPVGAGTTVLVHAGAGGLGQILTAWARQKGAMVIATVGSEAKADVARTAGAKHVLLHTDLGLEAAVRDLTGGAGVHVVYDGIGGPTLRRSLACVRPFGTVASLGQAGGPIPPVDLKELGPPRSIALSCPSVIAYANEPDTYREATAALFAALRNGLPHPAAVEYPLAAAAQAQSDLEAGRTTGSIILVP